MKVKSAISYLYQNPRVTVGIATFILFIVFNATRRPLESEATRGYEAWLKNVEELARIAESDPAVIPEITISLQSRKNEVGLNWKFATSKESTQKEHNERILRLLDLIRASRILEESRPASAELHLKVTEKDKTFNAYFEREDATKNVSLGNFLKLFQIYVTTVPGSAEKISNIQRDAEN